MTPDNATSDTASPNDGGGGVAGANKTQSSSDNKRYHRRGFRKPNGMTTGRPVIKQPKFEGRCEDLKGHIYDCSDARQSSDTRLAIENLSLPALTLPTDPAGDNKTLQRIWEKEVDEYVKRKTYLEDNMKTVYSLVWGQCTDVMRQRIEALDTYETISINADGLGLLKAIKDLVYNFQSQKYLPHALHESKRRFYFCTQGRTTTISAYLEQFQNVVDVIEHSGGSVGNDPGILAALAAEKKQAIAEMSTADKESLRKEAQEQYLAVAFLLSSDRGRYGRLIEGLENDFIQGQDRYPKNVAAAFSLLTNWKQSTMRTTEMPNEGVSFLNTDDHDEEESEIALATDGQPKTNYKGKNFDKAKVTCHKCGKKGHYAPECEQEQRQPERQADRQQTGEQMLMAGLESGEFDGEDHAAFQFHQAGVTMKTSETGRVPRTWILLDNQSTVDVFHNEDLLSNIRQGDGYMDIHCNAGVTSTNLIGDLQGYGQVWYNPNGIANILSLSRVKQRGFRVTFDSGNTNEFHVHKSNGTKRVFKQSSRGLYYADTAQVGIALVNTVEDNKSKFTNRDYSRAVIARKTQKMIGRPRNHTYINIVQNNLLKKCPVTRRDIAIADAIFGPDKGSLQGKTVRGKPTRVETTLTDIPAHIMEHYRDLTLGGDIMFVNGIPFFMTISRNIKFGTAEMLKTQHNKTILAAIKQVKSVYMKRGFKIKHMLMDGQFESLRADIADLQITLNTVANDEHVPEIERRIRTVKERTRCIYNTLPFNQMPPRIVIEMVYSSNFWLNSFPPEDGVSVELSPRAIIAGLEINYEKHCQIEFGSYVQTHEEHNNSMASRTTGAIALRPTGNEQGGYYFFSLSTGRRINRNRWTPLPMPNDVIVRVRNMARRANANRGLAFTDRHGNPVPNEDDDGDDDADTDSDDESYRPNDDDEEDDDENTQTTNEDHIAGVNYQNENEENDNNVDDDHNNNDQNENGNANNEGNDNNNNNVDDNYEQAPNNEHHEDYHEDNNNNNGNDIEAVDEPAATQDDDEEIEPPEGTHRHITQEMDEKYGSRNSNHGLRSRRPRDYSHLHTTLESTAMTQHSMKKGLREFGTEGTEAVLKELEQLHSRNVMEPKDPKTMTFMEKKRALEYLMFLKKKRNGTIKGRGCANGKKQRAYINKEDASSPTVAIESVLLSCVIDAEEHRDVATADIPGAFMQAEMDELVHMKLEGKMAELLVKIDPKLYRKYVQIEKGKQILYVELKKALYGTLRAALLFWKKLSAVLQEWGFEINPYDFCVANKMIDGKQCTVLWHVDDLKISHVDPKVVSSVLEQLEEEFGKEAPLTITRGKIHDYLGMTLDFSTIGKIMVTMIDYIISMLKDLPADMDGEAATGAANHLFEVNENATKLDEKTALMFHNLVAKMLFLCKRARPDIQTPVSFLCKRVKGPDTDDYKKLTRVVRYLRGTLRMPLTLEANNMHVVKWWVDASFATHNDMKSHTGAVMTLGKGAIHGMSTGQKLNTKSSTEAEIVGVNDAMPQILWTRYFLEAQGYGVKDSIIYQDNQSSILLEKHGKASSSKRTRHINIRYFFVTDRIASGEVSVEYCPTGVMIADFFTKPLQGILFQKFRNFIMNIDQQTYSMQDHRSVLGKVENPETRDGGETDEVKPAAKPTNNIEPKADSNGWTTVKHKRK
jgi:hypothetical protein